MLVHIYEETYTFTHTCNETCMQCMTVIAVCTPPLPPANAAVLLLVSLLYFYRVHETKVVSNSLYPVDFLYVIVGLELIFVLPCLVYYIGM